MRSDLQATVYPLYAVPMLQSHFPDAGRINPELANLFLRLESDGVRHQTPIQLDTQQGIFESNFYLHERKEPAVKLLFNFIEATLRGFVQNINRYTDQQMEQIKLDMHSWFHITRNGGFQGLHNHPNASWSAIYCVDPGDADLPSSGAVRFHDPRACANMYRDPTNSSMQTPYQIGPWQLTHKPGQLLIFPSYLTHEIFPYQGQRPRIVIALNSWCRH